MPWTEEKNILHHYLFGNEIIQNGVSKISQEVQLQQLSPEESNLSLGTQISSHRILKQPQQEGRNIQIWQEAYCKIS